MGVLTSSISGSVAQIRQKWRRLPAIALLDFAFLLLLGMGGFFFSYASNNPLSNIVESGGRLTTEISAAMAEGSSALGTFLADSVVMSNLFSILSYAMIYLIFAYLIWIGLEGFAWFYSNKIIHNINRKEYLSNFSTLSAKIFSFAVVYFILVVLIILFALLRPDRIISSSIISTITMILNFIIAYFMLISISYLPKNSLWIGFRKGIKKIKYFGAAFLLVIAVLIAVSAATFYILKPFTATVTGAYVVAAIRFILIAPVITWGRILFIELAKKN